MPARSIAPGLFMVTGICGIIDAACFLKLGGVFAEIMTGNLMFLAFALGQGNFAEDLPVVLVPLVSFGIGALLGGLVLRQRLLPGGARAGFLVTAVLVAVAAALAVVWQPEGDSFHSRVVVGILAFGMGIQNVLVLQHGHPDIATNVMTLTLVRLLSNWSIVGGDNLRWRLRLGSLLAFFAGAGLGAFMLRFGAGGALVTAAVLYAFALVWIWNGRPIDSTV
jgi:uncharacterized membrane protein YoaK (UPF0700 family)